MDVVWEKDPLYSGAIRGLPSSMRHHIIGLNIEVQLLSCINIISLHSFFEVLTLTIFSTIEQSFLQCVFNANGYHITNSLGDAQH